MHNILLILVFFFSLPILRIQASNAQATVVKSTIYRQYTAHRTTTYSSTGIYRHTIVYIQLHTTHSTYIPKTIR